MADIFQEIDEDLRRDRWENVWKKYGKYVLGAAAIIVLGTAAWVGWQEYKLQQNLSVTYQMRAAMEAARAGNSEAAIEGFTAVSAAGDSQQAALALFQEAALRANNDDIESARGMYQAIRDNGDLADPYRALATIRLVEVDLDTGDAAAMLAWLAPLAEDASEWRFVAWELSAYLEKRQGNIPNAKVFLDRLLADEDTPVTARARAEAYLAQL